MSVDGWGVFVGCVFCVGLDEVGVSAWVGRVCCLCVLMGPRIGGRLCCDCALCYCGGGGRGVGLFVCLVCAEHDAAQWCCGRRLCCGGRGSLIVAVTASGAAQISCIRRLTLHLLPLVTQVAPRHGPVPPDLHERWGVRGDFWRRRWDCEGAYRFAVKKRACTHRDKAEETDGGSCSTYPTMRHTAGPADARDGRAAAGRRGLGSMHDFVYQRRGVGGVLRLRVRWGNGDRRTKGHGDRVMVVIEMHRQLYTPRKKGTG